MPTFAFYKYFRLTWELSTFFRWMTMLTTTMATVRSLFLTQFFAWMMFMSFLTALFMTLNSAFMSTF